MALGARSLLWFMRHSGYAGTLPCVIAAVIDLDAATVLLQWAVGGLFIGWVTTRRREVGLGYGWMLRITYGLMAVGALIVGLRYGSVPVREVACAAVICATAVALGSSIHRRRVGVRGSSTEHDRRSARVREMTGIDRRVDLVEIEPDQDGMSEFDPRLDLIPVIVGSFGLVAAGMAAAEGGLDTMLSVARVLVGAVFLGAITDAMLLGHWYLVQPGLPRRHLNELVRIVGVTWPLEVGVLLVPTGMVSVLNGTIDDGWNGTLGWFWVACAITTIVLVRVTVAALAEKQYSAVMAATGLLYLAILSAFGTDLVARAVLAG